MRLSSFIQKYKQAIIVDWENFAKTMTPASDNMSRLQLKDHIEQLLFFIAKDIKSVQSSSQQIKKSHGKRDNPDDRPDSAAEKHGMLRQDSGFDIVQMISEYRALRSSIIKLWTKYKKNMDKIDIEDLTRFNEAIDQTLAESIVRFMKEMDYSKDLLLGVLGHDIRSPLGGIQLAAELMLQIGGLNEKQTHLATQIQTSSMRISKIVSDLLDLTLARLGTSLYVNKEEMDMGILARYVIEEITVQNPQRSIQLETTGEIKGQWDMTRLGQLFSNLINNAVQYGSHNSCIMITVNGNEKEVVISVHNEGDPIPINKLPTLFDSFTRGKDDDNKIANAQSNLGLGLFITREIVRSHDGSINVISNENDGTTFTVRLPKNNVTFE